MSHPPRFLGYLLYLHVDTCSCLHVCPLLAYYGESYFAQQECYCILGTADLIYLLQRTNVQDILIPQCNLTKMLLNKSGNI
jgi:hypothetical protein